MILTKPLFYALLSFSPCNVLAKVLSPGDYWQVTPALNYSDTLYAGWEQIPVLKEVIVYNGSLVGRTVCLSCSLL
jgi:hypothetical protein